ncbi:hypothetical protein F8388_000151 [Cannabis sativa]|uniref:Uncharacterized protein n=1 Tax=Cannabis sativa TaxID=3483 RepID=A0A7J6F2T5_CANSA|nr:hypothetical protein F8388_000151 [Cannabis sativa]
MDYFLMQEIQRNRTEEYSQPSLIISYKLNNTLEFYSYTVSGIYSVLEGKVAVMESLQGYTVLFLVWLVSTMLVRAMLTTSQTMVRLPPSPFAFLVIGHLHLLGPIQHQYFQKISNTY